MNVSIFGLGYVGCVSAGCLAQNGHKIIGVDVSETKVGQINSGNATIIEKDIDDIIRKQVKNGRIFATQDYSLAVQDSDISIICVGTPTSANGHLDLSYIFNVVNQIAESLKKKNRFHVIAIRSTVNPGTSEKCAEIISEISGKINGKDFAVLSNPEFLREGSAVQDYFNPPFTLIGSENIYAVEQMSELYKSIDAEIIVTKTRTAEILKYINNSFHALKISFANEVGKICKALGIDSHELMEIFSKDKQLNISSYYLKPGFAYGGSCLPKDLKAINTIAHDLYIDVPVLSHIEHSNDLQKKYAYDLVTSLSKKNIGFLGISFKSGTDDLRRSPSVDLVEMLVGKGYSIKIYDREINLSKLTGRNKEYIEKHLPHLSELMVSSFQQLLNESDVIVISKKDLEHKDAINNSLSSKYIVDLVRYDENLIGKKNYYGLCW